MRIKSVCMLFPAEILDLLVLAACPLQHKPILPPYVNVLFEKKKKVKVTHFHICLKLKSL